MKPTVLVVEDDRYLREEMQGGLSEAGLETLAVESAELGLEAVATRSFDLCISDIRLPGMDGIELLGRLSELCPETAVVIVTAHGDTTTAIAALRAGAADYVLKPFVLEDLLGKARRIVEHRRLVREVSTMRRVAAESELRHGMVGRSVALARIGRTILKVARTRSSVIVTGESGTGKELVACAIHDAGSNPAAPFVPINCAAIPETLLESELFGYVKGAFTGAVTSKEGLLQAARDGTVFLDEVAEMPLSVQAKLLRAVESREVQPLGSVRRIPIAARIVAATNRELSVEVTTGRFREDLYFRLAVIEIAVPPLRERREDIAPLVEHFVQHFNRRIGRRFVGVSNDAMQLLVGYDWKGNVRELQNVVERAMIVGEGELIAVEDLPISVQAAPPLAPDSCLNLRLATRRFEVDYVRRVVDMCEGDKRRAASLLGLSLSSLYRKLEAGAHA